MDHIIHQSALNTSLPTEWSSSYIMWWSLVIVLFVGRAGADHFGAWKTDTEYQYAVDAITISGLPKVSDAGIILRALMTVRPTNELTLEAKISNVRYSQITTDSPYISPLDDSWRHNDLEFEELAVSENVFLIRMKNGDISELFMSNDVPIWQINMIKSIVSQLQISYTTDTKMETSISGRCEVKYTHLPHPEAVKIRKEKDFCKCDQRVSCHFGSTGSSSWENCKSGNASEFLTRRSVSEIYVTTTNDGTTFTIQSSFTTNEVLVSPGLYEKLIGIVRSSAYLSLSKMSPIDSSLWTIPSNLESVGNLVYNYNSPFVRRYNIRKDNDKSCWQSRQNLNEAPASLQMPVFVGYREQPISDLNEIDPVATAKSLANDIRTGLENPNTIPEEQTLEKFSILADVIRTMSTEQIAETQRGIEHHRVERSGNRGIWHIFRDAVAQAGTGPALMTIIDWIVEKKIEGIEAASVVSVLSTTARNPTPEYLDAFFKLITMPSTANEEFLNATAITTFAELVGYYAQVNLATTNNTPTYCFGRRAFEYNPAILCDYIPHLSEQLEKSIRHNENAKSHVFIHALGRIANPAILNIFEYHLTEIPMSTFQRLLMVLSMRKLATLRPSLVRGVLYDIYKNTREADQVRAAAVALFMLTDPPESMLREMIEIMNNDNSKIVNEVVRSSIQSASLLKTPKFLDLQKKALNVLHLLNNTMESENAVNELGDVVASEHNLTYSYHNYINTDDLITLAYSNLEAIYVDMKMPKFEIGAIVTNDESIKKLWGNYLNNHNDEQDENNTWGIRMRMLHKLLKSKRLSEEIEPEGAFWIKTEYNSRFISYDKHNLKRIPELLMKVSSFLKEGRDFNMLNIASNDLTISFPMESGFPFLYTRKVPAMLKVSGTAKIENSPDFIKGVIDLSLVYSNQIQARLGFLTPFDHQYHTIGVNKNFQAYLPVRAEFDYEKTDNRATLKLQAAEQNKKYKLLHSSVVPFISRHNILSMSPITEDENSRKLLNISEWRVASRNMGMSFEIVADHYELFRPKLEFLPSTVLKRILVPYETDMKYSKSEVYLSPDESEDQTVIFTLSFESLYSDKDEKRSCFKVKAPIVSSNKINDPERRSVLLKEAIKGIPSGYGIAYDFGIEVPGQTPFHYVVTVASVASTIDGERRVLTYARQSTSNRDMPVEQCIAYVIRSHRLYRDLNLDWRFGETCENGYNVQINGKQEQTDEFREDLIKFTNECEQAISSGSKPDPHCWDNFLKTSTLDKLRFHIKFGPESNNIIEHLNGILYAAGKLYPNSQSSYIDDKYIDENVVKISMDLVPFNNSAIFSFQSANVRVNAELEVNRLISFITDTELNRSMNTSSLISKDEHMKEDECLPDDEETDDVDLSSNTSGENGSCLLDIEEEESNLLLSNRKIKFAFLDLNIFVVLNGTVIGQDNAYKYTAKNGVNFQVKHFRINIRSVLRFIPERDELFSDHDGVNKESRIDYYRFICDSESSDLRPRFAIIDPDKL